MHYWYDALEFLHSFEDYVSLSTLRHHRLTVKMTQLYQRTLRPNLCGIHSINLNRNHFNDICKSVCQILTSDYNEASYWTINVYFRTKYYIFVCLKVNIKQCRRIVEISYAYEEKKKKERKKSSFETFVFKVKSLAFWMIIEIRWYSIDSSCESISLFFDVYHLELLFSYFK